MQSPAFHESCRGFLPGRWLGFLGAKAGAESADFFLPREAGSLHEVLVRPEHLDLTEECKETTKLEVESLARAPQLEQALQQVNSTSAFHGAFHSPLQGVEPPRETLPTAGGVRIARRIPAPPGQTNSLGGAGGIG